MHKGFLIQESLNNPSILDKYSVERIIVENHPEYDGEPKIWHDYKLLVTSKDKDEVFNEISENIKEEWYAHFWSKENLYVILPNKVFIMPREDGNWHSKQYQDCISYAKKHGVEEEYLKDFLIED